MQDTQGFPLLQRDLHQVEQLSQKLKSKARRIDAGADSLAAARLLAQEGISAQRYELVLTKDLSELGFFHVMKGSPQKLGVSLSCA